MNKRRETGTDILEGNVVYIILFVLFFGGMVYYIWGYQDGVVLWEDFYAKEIARLVNNAEPGREYIFDVTKATKIAKRNGYDSTSDIIKFDNRNNLVIVSLNRNDGKGAGFPFYNDVDVVEWRVEFGKLNFKVVEAQQ